jgi:hypothetical protein
VNEKVFILHATGTVILELHEDIHPYAPLLIAGLGGWVLEQARTNSFVHWLTRDTKQQIGWMLSRAEARELLRQAGALVVAVEGNA